MTVASCVETIKKAVKIKWLDQTVDGLVEGNEADDIRGIGVCMMPTIETLERAKSAGLNLLIAHEALYYDHRGAIDALLSDPVYLAKRDFVRRNSLNVFRFHDHPHRMAADMIAEGMARKLGWNSKAAAADPGSVKPSPAIPTGITRQFDETPVVANNTGLTGFSTNKSLGALVKELKSKLGGHGIRFVGDAGMQVEKIFTGWGFASRDNCLPLFSGRKNCVLVVGETHEWELTEYFRDSVRLGNKQALIVTGHVVSEDPGMEYCAEWLRGLFPGLNIVHLKNENPFSW